MEIMLAEFKIETCFQAFSGPELGYPTPSNFIAGRFKAVLLFWFFGDRVWLGGAMVLGKLPVPGRPTNLEKSRARA